MDLSLLSAAQIRLIERTSGAHLSTVREEEAREFATLGWQLLEAGDVKNALHALELARTGLPSEEDVAVAYGLALARNDRINAARPVLLNVLARRRTDIELWCVMGELELDALNYVRAAKCFKRCLELDPEAKHPSGRRARALIKKGEKLLQQAR